MDKSFIGLIVFIVAWIAARILSERAIKTLTEEEQERLFTGFSRYRVVSLIGVIALVALYYILRAFSPESAFSGLPMFVLFLVLYLLASSIFGFTKLKNMKMPEGYINQYLISTLVQYVGIFVFFGFLLNR